jgi:hypothetical protein
MYIFDIDGTIADCSHRLHFIQSQPKDWKAFFAACVDDKPIVEVIELIRILNICGFKIMLVTGRSDECRDKTSDWLYSNDVPYSRMYMRKAGDHRPDNEVKGELLDKLIHDWRSFSIRGVFEDRNQVIEMYRKRGLRVYQVADGNF